MRILAPHLLEEGQKSLLEIAQATICIEQACPKTIRQHSHRSYPSLEAIVEKLSRKYCLTQEQIHYWPFGLPSSAAEHG